MTDSKSETKKCNNKSKAMLTYGILQLGASLISAISLAAIAISLCSFKSQTKLFLNCVEDSSIEFNSSAEAVRYCNGGN